MATRRTLADEAIAGFGASLRLLVTEGILATGWFDESGSPPVSNVTGFVTLGNGTPITVSEKWHACLEEEGLRSFSMKDAMHYENNFLGWKGDDRRRDALLRRLATVVADPLLVRVVALIPHVDFNAFPAPERSRYGNDPLYCAIETCIRGVLRFDRRISLHYIHDMTDKAANFMKYFTKIRAKDQIVRYQCIAVSFADDRCHDGIQMADMAAYCMRAQIEGTATGIVAEIQKMLSSRDQLYDRFVYKSGELIWPK